MTILRDARPDLYEVWMDKAKDAYPLIAEHVREDPVGWMLKAASSLGNYLVEDEGGAIRLNTLLEAAQLQTAIQVLQLGALELVEARAALKE